MRAVPTTSKRKLGSDLISKRTQDANYELRIYASTSTWVQVVVPQAACLRNGYWYSTPLPPDTPGLRGRRGLSKWPAPG